MILRVKGAEPVEVKLDGVEVLVIHIGKRGSRINECNCLRIAAIDQMIVEHDTHKVDLKVRIFVQHWNPFWLFFFFSLTNMTGHIIASHLEVATVFAKAHRDLSLLNYLLVIHHIVDRLKSIEILPGSFLA